MNHHLKEHLEKAPVPRAHKPQHHHIAGSPAAQILSVLLGVSGALCILFWDQVYSIFPYILGTIMAATGALDLYRGIVTREYRQIETKLTSNGIVMLLLGIVVLIPKENADSIVGSIWGAIGLFKGTEELNVAIHHGCTNQPFVRETVHAVIELLLAVVLLLAPMDTVRHHILFLGLELIWSSIHLTKERKRLESQETR